MWLAINRLRVLLLFRDSATVNMISYDNQELCNGEFIGKLVEAIRQVADNYIIRFLHVLSIALFNWTEISATKFASSFTRSIVDIQRPACLGICVAIVSVASTLWWLFTLL